MQYQQYFEAVENIMDDYGGRPHWGKLHFQTAADAGAAVSAVGRLSRKCAPGSIPRACSRTRISTACLALAAVDRRLSLCLSRLKPARPLRLERRNVVLLLKSEVDVIEAVQQTVATEFVGRGVVMDDERAAKPAVVVNLAASRGQP